MATPAHADTIDDIFDLEATQARPAAQNPTVAPGVGGGPTNNPKNIRVNVDGIPDPIEFPEGTDPAVIQETVKRLGQQNQGPVQNFPHLPEAMGAAGGAAGAYIGAASPVPGGALIGAAAGGQGGHMLGQTIQDLSNGIDQSFDRIADNALAATKAGLMGGAFEGAGTVLKPAINMLTEPFAKAGRWVGKKLFVPVQQSEVVKQSDELLKSAGAPGLTSGQLSEAGTKRFGTIAETVAYNSLTSNVVNKIRSSQQQGLKDYTAALMEEWGKLPAKDAADLFKWAVDDNFNTLYKKPMDVAMQDIRENFMGAINATPLLRRLQNPNEKVSRFLTTMFQKEHDSNPAVFDKLIKVLQPAKGSSKTAALPSLSFDEAMELKTALRELSEKNFTDAAGKQMAIQAGTMSKQVDQMIRRDLAGVPDILRSYDQSMAQYAEGMATFKNDLVQKFMKKLEAEPGELANLLLQPGQTEFLGNVKTLVGDQFWKQTVEPRLGATLLYRSFGTPNARGTLSTEGAMSGTKLATELQKLATDGTAQQILGKGTYTKLLELAQTLDHVATPPKGIGGVFVQLGSAGAVGAVLGAGASAITGGDVPTGAVLGGVTFLLAPSMLGKLVARPDYIEAFKTGLKQTAATGKPAPGLITLIRQLAGQEVAKSFTQDPKPPAADTALPRANIFSRKSAFTPEAPPSSAPARSQTGK